jgi:Mce-associated membrane protein
VTADLPGRPSRALAVIAALLGLATVVLAVLVLAVARPHHRHDLALRTARTEALAAGRQAIINLDAISAATIDADLKRVRDGATGKFKDLFTKSEATLRDLYPKRHTTSSGTVSAAAVVSSDLDTATLLVASDRSVTDVDNPKGVTQASRWEVVMELHGGRWLMADLEPVP